MWLKKNLIKAIERRHTEIIVVEFSFIPRLQPLELSLSWKIPDQNLDFGNTRE